jgi:hypothetical protein
VIISRLQIGQTRRRVVNQGVLPSTPLYSEVLEKGKLDGASDIEGAKKGEGVRGDIHALLMKIMITG